MAVVLEAMERCIIRGYAQYNIGERVVFTDDEAIRLLEQFPDGWKEVKPEPVKMPTSQKALTAPAIDKMKHAPERKK
jgi:hypothetical protein